MYYFIYLLNKEDDLIDKKRFSSKVSDDEEAELSRICKKIDVKKSVIIRDGTLKEARRREREFDRRRC